MNLSSTHRIAGKFVKITSGAFQIFLLVTFILPSLALAATSYDPFAPISKETEDARLKSTKRAEIIRPVADFAALPFEVTKWVIDPVLYEVETRHIPKKISWIFDELKAKGITPSLGHGLVARGVGLDVDAVKLAKLNDQFEGFSWHNEVKWAPVRQEFLVRTGPKFERVLDTPLTLRGNFLYDRLGEEDFWGIGPDSGLGQGSNFDLEKSAFNIGADYDIAYEAQLSFDFNYEHVNIAEGFDSNETHSGGKNNIKAVFPVLPGINGSDEINFETRLEHDRRNNVDRPTKGHYEKIGFGYHHGVRGSDTRYFRYLTDLAFFLPIFSERRVLAARFYSEHNSELDSDEVPFFNKARLGGHLSDPARGLPLRSFERNRFFDDSVMVFNIEYRYNIWHYRDFKMDAVIFFDEGMVFDQFKEMQGQDFQESYGGGFRVFALDKNIMTVEAAHGNEGTEFYAKSSSVF